MDIEIVHRVNDTDAMLDKVDKICRFYSMKVIANHYEQACESWLLENSVQYVSVDQQKRQALMRDRIKSFDFLLYRVAGSPVMAEVKGRKFKGTSLAGLKGLQCWVTMDDVRGLIQWEQVFNASQERGGDQTCDAVFVFAYEFEKIDVDPNGREVYEFDGNRYVFYAVRLDDYREYMTVRSPKWQTVNLPAAKFRKLALPVRELIFG